MNSAALSSRAWSSSPPPTSPNKAHHHLLLLLPLPLFPPNPSTKTSSLISPSKLIPSPKKKTPPPSAPQPPSRLISRKKKRAVRIGCGRDSSGAPEDPPPPIETTSFGTTPISAEDPLSPPSRSVLIRTPILLLRSPLRLLHGKNCQINPLKKQTTRAHTRFLKFWIWSELGYLEIREAKASVSAERKDLGRRLRRAMEDVNSAPVRFRELEKELKEACEAEDFERAERVNESLAAAEKDGLLSTLRDAELECDSVDLKMQEVLELQIAAEEGVALHERFAKLIMQI